MSYVYSQRPGVYSSFDASTVTATGSGQKIIGLVGVSAGDSGLYTLTSYADGVAAFGADSQLAAMVQLAFQNGAGIILAAPVSSDEQSKYEAAATLILTTKSARYLVIGSSDEDIQSGVLDLVADGASQKAECIAIFGMEEPTVAELTARAAALNSNRGVLVGADVYGAGDSALGGCMAAAALAGALSAQTDPALPLNGLALGGFQGVTIQPSDSQVDLLVEGGVTPLELSDGAVRVVRGITTCTKVGGVSDATYRELNVMMIIDDIIPAIRASLQAKFLRAKNNQATRSAISSQVIVELENRITREIIDGYYDLSVSASDTDPTVCLVEFGMTVTHGLNRIYLTAHIAV